MIAEDPSVQAEVDTILSELSVAPSEEDAAAIAESRRQQFPVELSHLPEPPAHLRAYRTNRITPTAYPKALIEQSLMLAEAREEQALADSYIVTFHDEAFPYALQKTDSTAAQRVHSSGATLSQRAAQLVTTLGGDLYYTWDVALPGFAARLSESQVKELLANPEVKSVERDAVITLAYD